jgi:hypothetical protein
MAGAPPAPREYGTYRLRSAELITRPQLTDSGIDWFWEPDQEPRASADLPGGRGRSKRAIALKNQTLPVAKKPAKPSPAPAGPLPPPALPPISSVAVMNVGQGNCNVLIDQIKPPGKPKPEPAAYFDVGYPLPFFHNSLPANMRHGMPGYEGPYPLAAAKAANMDVVLSHWDWDHWRLGLVAQMQGLDWTIPQQPLGAVAINFVQGLANLTVVGPAVAAVHRANYTIYRCNPPAGMVPAALMNNSGLAVMAWTRLPAAEAIWHTVLLTADANFNTVSAAILGPAGKPIFPELTGITAAHHGSSNYGAAENLPAPVVPEGRIAYSYGILPGGAHPYGFPTQQAVQNYHAANWVQEQATAEGNPVHWPGGPNAGNPGNVRMGDQTALPAAFNSAFSIFANQLT